LIYLTRRAAGLGRVGFTARWRDHAALGMSRPRWINIARYVHTDLIEPASDERAFLSDHDGIGMIWHRSPEHRAAHLADTGSRQEMEADEALTFARPIVEVAMLTAEQVLIAPPTAGGVKLVVFSRDLFGTVPDSAIGHVRNLPLSPERPAGSGLKFATVDEFWFDDRAAAVAGALALGRPGRIAVIGRDVELYRL
jgi:hypothetical protein